jgi:WD40 repeat protein
VLIATNYSSRVVLCDAASLEPIRTFEFAGVRVLGHSRALDAFVAATRDGRLMRFGVGTEPEEIVDVGFSATNVAINDSGDAAVVANGAAQGDSAIVDLATERVEGELEGRSGAAGWIPGRSEFLVPGLDFSGDQEFLFVVSASGDTLARHLLPENFARRIAVSPAGRLVVGVQSYSDQVHGFDLESGRTHTIGSHESWVSHAAFVADRLVVTGDVGGVVRAWDAGRDRGTITAVEADAFMMGLAFDPASGRAAACDGPGRRIRFYDPATGALAGGWDVSRVGQPVDVALYPDGDRLVLLTREAIEVRETESGALIRDLQQAPPLSGLVYAPDVSADGRLIAAPVRDGHVSIWDAESFELLRNLRAEGTHPIMVAFSPDAHTLAVVHGSERGPGLLALWDVRTGERIGPAEEFDSGLLFVEFHPSGERVAVGGVRGQGWIVDVESRRRTMLMGIGDDTVESLSFTTDGTRLIGGIRSAVAVWDSASGRRLMTIPGPVHLYPNARVVLAPDGTLVAAGGNRVQFHPIADPP